MTPTNVFFIIVTRDIYIASEVPVITKNFPIIRNKYRTLRYGPLGRNRTEAGA